ncbi:MAG: UDP-N-acetylglucosamine 2-epimerase (non-hydrolyzing) [Bacteroidia bacterium]|nr:UDP-N-acetylglucosamine 2-epimerase (non-hydrolyzing) [Bacteroidia bacterium]
MSKILFAIGTRPELIKVAPVVKELQRVGYKDYTILNTSQHTDLLDPYWDTFGLQPDVTLDFMRKGQSLSSLTSRAISQLQDYLDGLSEKPRILLSQGDTTTVMASSMVSFYNGIDFYHLEAGLRTFDFQNPFPEEYNRRVAGIIAAVHFAPTEISQQNLLNEGVDPSNVQIVGNTVIDSLNLIKESGQLNAEDLDPELHLQDGETNYVLITCHRRENHGENLQHIVSTVKELAGRYPQFRFVWAMHPNPNVRNAILDAGLSDIQNITLTQPLEYLDLLRIVANSAIILTDSGGIQEEAPSFGKPVLVMRNTTERPEGVDEGIAFLVGADKDKINTKFDQLIENPIAIRSNPYGDGLASKRVVETLLTNVSEVATS